MTPGRENSIINCYYQRPEGINNPREILAQARPPGHHVWAGSQGSEPVLLSQRPVHLGWEFLPDEGRGYISIADVIQLVVLQNF